MAIQIPNVGKGDGLTGENELVIRQKYNANFSDQTNAASRLLGTGAEQVPLSKNIPSLLGTAATKDVGTENGQVATWKGRSIEGTGLGGAESLMPNQKKETSFGGGLLLTGGSVEDENPAQVGGLNSYFNVINIKGRASNAASTQSQLYFFCNTNRMFFRARYIGGSGNTEEAWGKDAWAEVYTDKNTTVGTNKEIIKSSPVLRVFNDGIEKIHEANDLDIEFIVNGVGDYTVKGTTGIRDGREDWTINIPKDNHDNQLIAFTMEEEEGGIVHLKTYKRTFNMTTFMFEPDLNTPVDIPDGRWVDLHFNDIPQEQSNEPIE